MQKPTIADVSKLHLPEQPPEETWEFISELQSPLHQPIKWHRLQPHSQEADLRRGIRLSCDFTDPAGMLCTAYADFRYFLKMGNIPDEGDYQIITEHMPVKMPESYRIEVGRQKCRILAGDTEGIRRGLFFLEDELLRSGGPFLKLGAITKTPVIRTRISRCFFGPIKRPPKNRDELMDEVDYYPDEYLNRLAHDGVNGLWLTVEWKDLVATEMFPNSGNHAERRLEKLNRTIEQCARYGIGIYIFCIEPAALQHDNPALRQHPELAGHQRNGIVYFCTSSATGRQYVENTTRKIFNAAPGLAGMIVISVGERPTHCYSGGAAENNCPRCSKRLPREVLADTLAAMERGMHAVNPKAELISWPYSQYSPAIWGEQLTGDAAGHVPRNVILQHNFESGGRARQLGHTRFLGDYWLSYVGPSQIFSRCALNAVRKGTRMSAKLQVGCSHEVATVPFVPVPGNLYAKYKAMHKLGVSAAMYSWYFGSYPSLMTRAAGELAFAPFPKSEHDFLEHLARRDWGANAPRVAAAWKHFQNGYRQFPYAMMAGYYGPFHDGPVWPLYLIPRDWPLAPTWQIKHGVSGDRIGEMICYSHTAREYQTLFNGMVREWNCGLQLLAPLAKLYAAGTEQRRELGVAEALGIQFESGRNILDFYLLREELPFDPPAKQKQTLARMRAIVLRELELDRRLIALAAADSRLGFHSEAEGYKYHPALIKWRMRRLRNLLQNEFPKIAIQIKQHRALFAQYSGAQPEGAIYQCRKFRVLPVMNGCPTGPDWDRLPEATCEFVMSPHDSWVENLAQTEHSPRKTTWKAGHDGKNLYIGIRCHEPEIAAIKTIQDKSGHIPYPYWNGDCAGIMIEPRRLWPCQMFLVNAAGARWQRWESRAGENWRASVWRGKDEWSLILRIPFATLVQTPPSNRRHMMRIDILRMTPPDPAKPLSERVIRWMKCKTWPSRLALRRDNPTDLGWLEITRH